MEMSMGLLGALMAGILGGSTPSPVETYTLPAIAGLWQIELDDVHTCQERYNFGKNGKLNTTSAKEYTVGEYSFSYLENSPLPVLAVMTTQDNNGIDCSGNQVDQTGESFASFVKLDNKHSPTVMQWCADPQGNDCPVRLVRILP
ncbi:MAG: hypothetical protein Q4G13_05305 [Moraxella sp.]|nr:hypothetical protein [Moraxella sp.]